MTRGELIRKIHNGDIFAITEYCPCCDSEATIWSYGISACSECGEPILPCSMCNTAEVDCCRDCPYNEYGGAMNDNGKRRVTMPSIKFARY